MDPRTGTYSTGHSELQNSDVSEGKTEHSHAGGKSGTGATGGGTSRDKRNGKVHKPVLLHQNSTEVSSTNQVEVPDTTQSSPVSISSGLNSDPDMADSPAVTGMSHVASVMSSLSQSVFMSEVPGDPVYSMSPTGGANAHLMGPDATSHGLVLTVTSDSHKFAFPGSGGTESGTPGATDGLAMLSGAGVSEELVLSSSLDSSNIKLPEATMNFDPDCFLNNPKQGQTYGGSGLKQENGSSGTSSSVANTNDLQHSPPMSDSSFSFSSDIIKNIKTEDTSFEQQLAKESGYQIGPVISCSVSNGSAPQTSLTLTPAGALLPSGGGLSPSTTLEQMDFSAIDAKPDFSSNTSVGYDQAMTNTHLTHQSHSPSFFLQDTQSAQNHQGRQNSGQKSHLLEHNSHDRAYMGLQVVKTDSPGTNGHLHHHHGHQSQHRSNCNGNSATENQGQSGSLQLLQYPGGFSGLGTEHEDVVSHDQAGSTASSQTSGAETRSDGLLKPGDHMQACAGGNTEDGGSERYLQQGSENGVSSEAVTLRNGNSSDSTNGQQQLQPLLQGAGLVQGLYNTVGTHQSLSGAGAGSTGGTGMEISLDHFDISFGNQFSDLINDFISVDGGVTAVGSGGGLYAHQLVAPHGSDGQAASGGNQQPGQGGGNNRATGYGTSDLCLQPCCSPQGLGGGTTGGGGSGDTGSLSYMHVADVVSAAVAQGTLGMLQATGRLFMVTDYSPEWSYPEVGKFNCPQ